MPEISVVIPTRNRAAFLERNLRSLCKQNIDPARYEICVVNNASADETPQVIEKIKNEFPGHKIFIVDEPETGVTIARNTGIHATSAPLIVMSDDDATVKPEWLSQFLAHFAEKSDRLAKVAGEIVPVWAAPRPHWLTDDMLPLLSASSGMEPKAQYVESPLVEGNSCYRREALLQVGGFPRALGRSGNRLLSGDHTVDRIMLLKGWKLFHDPSILLFHTIHADRLTPGWMRRRYFWQGVSDYAGRIYLKKQGVSIDHALRLEMPLGQADWAFVNDNVTPPVKESLEKLHSLGLVLAMSGILPVEV